MKDADVLKDLEDFYKSETKRLIEKTDITASRLADRSGVNEKTAKLHIKKLVKEGKLICVGIVKNEQGKVVTAYKLPKHVNSKKQ